MCSLKFRENYSKATAAGGGSGGYYIDQEIDQEKLFKI